MFGTRVRQGLAALALVGVGVGGVAAQAGAQASSGFVGGGSAYGGMTYTYTPGTVSVEVSCSSNRVTISPKVNTQSGYTGGQWVSYQYRVTNRQTGWSATSDFSGATFIGGGTNYPYSYLATAVYQPGIRANWTVEVQVAYYQGSAWSFSGFVRPGSGYGPPMMASDGYSYYLNNCYTS